MTRQEAITYIVDHPEFFLQPDKSSQNGHKITGHWSYICPFCGSGTGKNGTGMTTRDGIHFTCWNGQCQEEVRHNDVLDIIGKYYQLSSFTEILDKACEIYNLTVDGKEKREPRLEVNKSPYYIQKVQKNEADQADVQMEDYTDYYKECEDRLTDCSYLEDRGISLEICRKYHIGYDPQWISPKVKREGKRGYPSKRIIIPISRSAYLARDIRADDDIPDKEKNYKKMKEGNSTPYHLEVLESVGHEPIIVVEGEIDLLSVSEAGYENVIALGGTSNYRSLAEAFQKQKPCSVILSLDNDPAGIKATFDLTALLTKLEIPWIAYNISGRYKDPNEALVNDRDGFIHAIKAALEKNKQFFQN